MLGQLCNGQFSVRGPHTSSHEKSINGFIGPEKLLSFVFLDETFPAVLCSNQLENVNQSKEGEKNNYRKSYISLEKYFVKVKVEIKRENNSSFSIISGIPSEE